MENDYSQQEIDNIIDELLGLRRSSLKPEEIYFIEQCLHKTVYVGQLDQSERDKLIKLYDAIGEAGY